MENITQIIVAVLIMSFEAHTMTRNSEKFKLNNTTMHLLPYPSPLPDVFFHYRGVVGFIEWNVALQYKNKTIVELL